MYLTIMLSVASCTQPSILSDLFSKKLFDGDFLKEDIDPLFTSVSLKSNIGCPVCKASGWIIRETFGSKPSTWVIKNSVKLLCKGVLDVFKLKKGGREISS